jgi:hypothetical protein
VNPPRNLTHFDIDALNHYFPQEIDFSAYTGEKNIDMSELMET